MIHYHGTPCSGTRADAAQFIAGRHVMIPFPHPADLPIALEVCASFCLDNGAFSVWKKGGTLDSAAYARFVESVMFHPSFDWAVIPDIIGGSEADNDRLIAEWPYGRAGVPVWHLHESLGRLLKLACGWPRVAIGSSGQWSTPGSDSWWDRMGEAMDVVDIGGGRPRCKLHGLRMLSVDIFTRLPLASADSTNAVRNSNLVRRFGSYPPPSQGARMSLIASRIEAHQSAAVWERKREADLFALQEE